MKALVLLTFLLTFTLSVFAQDNTAPDFNLPDMDGKNYQLSENIGQGPILINFWATWCIPCRAEMKKLKEIYNDYHEQGLEILSISIDDTKTVNKVKGFVKTNRYPFTILLDTNSEVFQLYQGSNPPQTVLIDQNGKIVYSHTGYRKGDEIKLAEEIAKLLKKE